MTSAGYESYYGLTKDTPLLICEGELWSVFCEYFGVKQCCQKEVQLCLHFFLRGMSSLPRDQWATMCLWQQYDPPTLCPARVALRQGICRQCLSYFKANGTLSTCGAEFILKKHKNISTFSIISQDQGGAVRSNPSLWKTRTFLSYILWLLMAWWLEEPGHQKPWYWSSLPWIFWFQRQKGSLIFLWVMRL